MVIWSIDVIDMSQADENVMGQDRAPHLLQQAAGIMPALIVALFEQTGLNLLPVLQPLTGHNVG